MADNPHLLDSLLEDIESAVGSEGVQKSPLKYIPHPPHSDKHQSKVDRYIHSFIVIAYKSYTDES